jgi:hypothetical protein
MVDFYVYFAENMPWATVRDTACELAGFLTGARDGTKKVTRSMTWTYDRPVEDPKPIMACNVPPVEMASPYTCTQEIDHLCIEVGLSLEDMNLSIIVRGDYDIVISASKRHPIRIMAYPPWENPGGVEWDFCGFSVGN